MSIEYEKFLKIVKNLWLFSHIKSNYAEIWKEKRKIEIKRKFPYFRRILY